MRIGVPCILPLRNCTRPGLALSSSGGADRSRSPSATAPLGPAIWKYTLSTSSARRMSRAEPGRRGASLPFTSWICCASTVTLSSSAWSKGWLAMDLATR